MRNGVIASIDADAAAPAGAQVIDAKGADVYPGFIDARSTLGLIEPGPRGFEDAQEMLEINAAVRAQRSLSLRQRRHSRRARQRRHHRGRGPGRRAHRRSSGGDEPRRLDVGRSHA